MEERHEDDVLLRATYVTVAIHAIVPALLLMFMAFGMPRFIRMFWEMQVELPTAVKFLIQISNLVRHRAFILIPAVMVLLLADAGIYFAIRRASGKAAARGWSAVVLSVQVVVLIGCILALFLPLIHLMQSMGP